jgi:Tol biopolymer transport system component
MGDDRLDREIREFLARQAEDISSAPNAEEVAMRISSGRGARSYGFRLAPQLVWVALAGLLIAALVGAGVGAMAPRNNLALVPSDHALVPTDQAVDPTDPVGASSGAVAYATGRGLSALYVVRPGGEPRKIAPTDIIGNDVVCPAFSPDGTMLAVGMPGGSIVVLSADEQGEIGDGRRLDGGRVSETPHCAAWAPDSSAVAFLDDSALVIVPLRGEPQRIAGWDVPGAGNDAFLGDYPPDRAIQWSPDGSAIAVARPSGTWLIPIDGAPPRRLNETPVYSVSWSPDATRLVVAAAGPRALVIRAADGTPLAEFATGFSPPAWSPVDDLIAITDDGLVLVSPTGGDRVVIDDYGYDVTWSPDGRHVMYVQDVASAAWQLVIANAAGTGSPTTIVERVPIPDARSFPPAQQFSWQPVAAGAGVP